MLNDMTGKKCNVIVTIFCLIFTISSSSKPGLNSQHVFLLFLVTGPLFLMGTILVITATVMYGNFAKQVNSYPSVPSHVQKTPPKKRKSSPVANY